MSQVARQKLDGRKQQIVEQFVKDKKNRGKGLQKKVRDFMYDTKQSLKRERNHCFDEDIGRKKKIVSSQTIYRFQTPTKGKASNLPLRLGLGLSGQQNWKKQNELVSLMMPSSSGKTEKVQIELIVRKVTNQVAVLKPTFLDDDSTKEAEEMESSKEDKSQCKTIKTKYIFPRYRRKKNKDGNTILKRFQRRIVPKSKDSKQKEEKEVEQKVEKKDVSDINTSKKEQSQQKVEDNPYSRLLPIKYKRGKTHIGDTSVRQKRYQNKERVHTSAPQTLPALPFQFPKEAIKQKEKEQTKQIQLANKTLSESKEQKQKSTGDQIQKKQPQVDGKEEKIAHTLQIENAAHKTKLQKKEYPEGGIFGIVGVPISVPRFLPKKKEQHPKMQNIPTAKVENNYSIFARKKVEPANNESNINKQSHFVQAWKNEPQSILNKQYRSTSRTLVSKELEGKRQYYANEHKIQSIFDRSKIPVFDVKNLTNFNSLKLQTSKPFSQSQHSGLSLFSSKIDTDLFLKNIEKAPEQQEQPPLTKLVEPKAEKEKEQVDKQIQQITEMYNKFQIGTQSPILSLAQNQIQKRTFPLPPTSLFDSSSSYIKNLFSCRRAPKRQTSIFSQNPREQKSKSKSLGQKERERELLRAANRKKKNEIRIE